QIDGLAPSAWLATAAPLFMPALPNDPKADPSAIARYLPKLLGHHATTVTFSRCQTTGGCAPMSAIQLADAVYASVSQNGGYDGSSLYCTPRFKPSVSSPPVDGTTYDVPVVETAGGITSVQFDGFEGAYDDTATNPYAAWEDPWTTAFSGTTPVLVDARMGHGGSFTLGKWLFQLMRGTDQPEGSFAM